MKTRKIICVILAIVFCLTATLVVVTANTKTAAIEISSGKSELSTGESTTVSVNVTTNFPVATMSIPVFYDKTMVTVSEATATLTDYEVKNTTNDSQSVDSSKIYANTGINEDEFGFVLVNYIGSANTQVRETIDDVVLTFKITAKSDVEGNVLIKCVSESAKTGNNVAGMLYFGSTTNGTKIDSIPENVENIDVTEASQTVVITKSSEPNRLMIKSDAPYEPIIDTVNKGEFTGTVYGIDTLGYNDNGEVDGRIADFVTTAYGDEYLEIIVGESGIETTGTIINVLDENGNAVEAYVFVYFGDVDMDGMVSSGDGTTIIDWEYNFEYPMEEYLNIAADVDGDGMVSSGDGTILIDFEYYFDAEMAGYMSQAEIAFKRQQVNI